jgi:hypothetical protein
MRYCFRVITRSKNKKAPAGREAEGALAANRARDHRVMLEMVDLIALMGRLALRSRITVVENR